MGYQETRELYVRVNTADEVEKVKSIFESYNVAAINCVDPFVIQNVWISMDSIDFDKLRKDIYKVAPGCLLLASCSKYHSVGGNCGYSIYAKYPDREREEYSSDSLEERCPVFINDIKDAKSCLQWISKANLFPEISDMISIHRIWGNEVDESYFAPALNDANVKEYLKSLLIKDPVISGNVSKGSNTIYRLCVVAKDDDTLELIKNLIKEKVELGNEIVSKATYIPEKNMMYLITSDLYENYYQGSIESVVYDVMEDAKGKFIIISDRFAQYEDECDEGYVTEEGCAECSLGLDMKDFAWDCCDFDESMDDNFDLNITDILGFLNVYDFEMECEEQNFISAFGNVVVDNMKTKGQVTTITGCTESEYEDRGDELDFKHKTNMEEMPLGYFEEKRTDDIHDGNCDWDAEQEDKCEEDGLIQEGATKIESYEFSDDLNLKRIRIPEGVKAIEEGAFYGCENLIEVIIPESVTIIEENAFSQCIGLQSIIIPKNAEIGPYAFFGCTGLSSVTIQEGVKLIGADAFLGCESLTTVEIPYSVTTIDYEAFAGCENLTAVTILNNKTSIGIQAFQGCNNLIVYAPADSEAEQTCKEFGISFVACEW